MSNRWIITNHRFHQHKTLATAEKERARLAAKWPEAEFTIHRLKGELEPSNAAVTIKALRNRNLELVEAATFFENQLEQAWQDGAWRITTQVAEALGRLRVAIQKAGAP